MFVASAEAPHLHKLVRPVKPDHVRRCEGDGYQDGDLVAAMADRCTSARRKNTHVLLPHAFIELIIS